MERTDNMGNYHSGKVFYMLIAAFLLLHGISLYAQSAMNVETAYVGSGSKSARTLENFAAEGQFSKWGGCLSKRVEETGFFSTTKVDNAWYFVDPDGYLFISTGINSVVKGGGFVLPDSLQSIFCNTMACWSDETINSGSQNKIAYTPRWNMMLNYKNTTQRTKDLYAAGIIPVFDPGFPDFCMQLAASSIAPLKNDQYILGHFSDNELPVYDNTTYGKLLDRFLAITDKSDPNFIAADNWMKQRSGTGYTITAADRLEFHGFVTGTYYQVCKNAIKTYDPNHLYLGSRLHGGAKTVPYIFREAGKYVDVISINVYGVWTPSSTDMDMWVNESGKPFIVTEFYAKAEDSGISNVDGAGWLVKTQKDRALFFENFTLALLSHRGNVGFHYFKYIDNPTINCGLVNSSFKWYAPMKESFSKLGKNVYSLRDFLYYGYTGEGIGTVYSGTNYFLQARMLSEGEYSNTSLLSMGISSKSISSARIKPGYTLTLYSGNDFSGDSVRVTANTSNLISIGFLNKTGSLRISKDVVIGTGRIENTKQEFRVYPNPFSGNVEIEFDSESAGREISLFTVTGLLAMKINVPGRNNLIDTRFLDPGVYILISGNSGARIIKTL